MTVTVTFERWWLEEGTEQCPHCLYWIAWEAEVHCVDCDGPSCPMCSVELRERGGIICPGCTQPAED